MIRMRTLALLIALPATAAVSATTLTGDDRSLPVPIAATSLVTPVETSPAAAPVPYAIDPVHSELTFRVRHLVGRVAGTFNDWGGTIVLDPEDLSGGRVDITVQTASINTLNPDRDDHLRTPDFFAVDSFPTMTYRSDRVEVIGTRVTVHGELTLRGHTRPVILEGIYLGRIEEDPWGAERVAFLAQTRIDRQDFGVSFNQALETMTMIGDEIEIEIAIEAVRQ